MFKSVHLLGSVSLLCAGLFLLASCGGGQDDSVPGDGGSSSSGSPEGPPSGGTVIIEHDEVNGSTVTCARVFHVDANEWPPEGYPVGATGLYRYESEGRYLGPTDGKLPDGTPTGFRLSRESYDDHWTLMSTVGPGGDAEGYPWDNQRSPTDCPDGNTTWNNGTKVTAR